MRMDLSLAIGSVILGGVVLHADDAPAAIVLSASSISEDASVGDTVGTLSVTDGSGDYTFSITSDPDDKFSIVADALELAATLDYETATSHAVTIEADNGVDPVLSRQFTIDVLDETAVPTDIQLSAATVAEDASLGAVVGTLSATAPYGETLTYSLTDDAGGLFGLDGDDLIVTGVLDYETATSHDITVRATGREGYADQVLAITVTDVAESSGDVSVGDGTLVVDTTTVYDTQPAVAAIDSGVAFHGKKKADGSAGKFIFDLGAAAAGHIYIVKIRRDWSLLANGGATAMVGFGWRSGNDFRIVGVKGDGAGGLKKYAVYGANKWNQPSGFTTTDGGAAAHGTPTGTVWLALETNEDGTKTTLRSSDDGLSWDDEFALQTPSPFTNAGDPTTFGIAVFLDSSDAGNFRVDVTAWTNTLAGWYYSATQTVSNPTSTRTFSNFAIGAPQSNRTVVVPFTWSYALAASVDSVIIGGVQAKLVARDGNGNSRIHVYSAVVPTGTTADVTINWSTAVNGGCACAVYYGYPYLPEFMTAVGLAAGGGGNISLPDLRAKSGGAVIGVFTAGSSGGSNLVYAWGGTDSVSKSSEGSANNVDYSFAFTRTWQNVTANFDGDPDGSGSNTLVALTMLGATPVPYTSQRRPTYFHALSNGDRTATITCSTNLTLSSGTIDKLVDGSLTASSAGSCAFPNGATNGEITFDFGAAYVVDGFRWIQSSAVSHGVWIMRGSNDNSSWEHLGAYFTLGITSASARGYIVENTRAFRYYQLKQISGSTSSSPWLEEIHFRIAALADAIRDPVCTGDRTALVTISTTASVLNNSSISNLIDGDYAPSVESSFAFGSAQSTREIKFDFSVGKIITDFELFQNNTNGHGTWVSEGSNDDSSYAQLGSSFTLGGAIRQRQSLSNSTSYRYYRFRQTAGSTSTSPWLIEIEFNI